MTGLQKCPITGQMVPAEDMTQHLKILLLDPKSRRRRASNGVGHRTVDLGY